MSCPGGWCYHLKIQLSPDKITSPRIFRQIQVPGAITFHELHKAIMMAFRWGWNEEGTQSPGTFQVWQQQKTYLAEIVERPQFDANLIYTYISIDELRYKHKISVTHKTKRETDTDNLCIMVSKTGHCMAEGLTEEGWQSLKRIYQLPGSKRTDYENKLTEWYERECPNKHPLGLGNKRAFERRLPTEAGTPLGFLGAAHGCVVPAGKVTEFCINLTPSSPPRYLICPKTRRMLRSTESCS